MNWDEWQIPLTTDQFKIIKDEIRRLQEREKELTGEIKLHKEHRSELVIKNTELFGRLKNSEEQNRKLAEGLHLINQKSTDTWAMTEARETLKSCGLWEDGRE